MVKRKYMFFILLSLFSYCLFSYYGCKKDNNRSVTINTATTVREEEDLNFIENATQYVKVNGCYFYKNLEDVNTPIKQLKSDSYLWVDFGRKINVLDIKKVNNDYYYNVQLPDKSIYWAKKDFFTTKFITIIKTNVLCYEQPDTNWGATIKLQPGDFGTLIKEDDGWLNVEFKAYRPIKDNGERRWVGTYWIKEGYTDDINTAKQAFYLYMAYYYKLIKKDTKNAIEMLKKAFYIVNDEETEISYVIRDFLKELSREDSSSDINN